MDYTCYIIIGFPITYEKADELRVLAEENLELEDYIINFSQDDDYYFGFIENHSYHKNSLLCQQLLTPSFINGKKNCFLNANWKDIGGFRHYVKL